MKSDPCLYMWRDSRGTLLCIASTHVDDLKLIGNDDTVKWIITEMEKEIGKLKTAVKSFEHCGIKHNQLGGDILIHQNHYTTRLNPLVLLKECNLES